MTDVYIDISKDESARFDLYAGGIYELKIDSFSISMNADQFQQLCDNLRPWIVDDSAPQAPPAAVPAGYEVVPVEPTEAMLDVLYALRGSSWLTRHAYRSLLAAAREGE